MVHREGDGRPDDGFRPIVLKKPALVRGVWRLKNFFGQGGIVAQSWLSSSGIP